VINPSGNKKACGYGGENAEEDGLKRLAKLGTCLAVLLTFAVPAMAYRPPPLSPQDQKLLRDNFALCISKLKGPYTENFCVCSDGQKVPVRGASGRVDIGCKNPRFCAAFRAPWAEALAKKELYIANIFSRDLFLWDSFPDHNNLVRGYILEKYFTDTNPNSKLSRLRSFGGLSGAEYETPASARFFERYLSAPEFKDNRDFLLAYELQKRYFVQGDLGQIEKVRTLSVRIQVADSKFKPLRDAIHNQLSPSLVPQLLTYRDQLAPGPVRTQIDELATEIQKLTSLDANALKTLVARIEDERLRSQLTTLLPVTDGEPVAAISSLAQLMVLARRTAGAHQGSPADARRLIDLAITVGGVIQQRGNALLESHTGLSTKQHLQLLSALTDAAYGAGLLGEREREAATTVLRDLMSASHSRQDFTLKLKEAERVVEWAQSNAVLAFAEVWAAWSLVLPQTATIRDDILRSSPLLLYAQIASRLDDYAAGPQRTRHDLFGSEADTDVRALNPGLALGVLRVAPQDAAYTRDEIVALPDTPADLDPAAGILTQGEGNVLSHVQLLARALGIPNVVLGPSAYRKIAPHNGQRVFFIVTPGGRVIIKQASAMTPQDKAVYEEYTRNQTRRADGSLGNQGPRLHIDRAKIDLSKNLPIDLKEVRRKDSGRFCGPKAAYLGELKQLFPEHVARGIVVPFGAYHSHYQNAKVIVPDKLRSLGVATTGEPLPGFVERTYHEFFQVMIPAKKNEKDLTAWINPRLDVIRHSIRQSPLSAALKQAIRDGLDRNGLLRSDDKSQSVGCFIRSDTNVEDLDNFNGAGLNLTVFNRRSLEEIYEGLKEVWASPFEFRSFSWRQSLIDDPIWVLSSVVILESVPNDKSGVLVTADVDSGDIGKMTVATSEGVGGAVDGTSAETLVWSPQSLELVTLFKSPWKTQLMPNGGSAVVPSTGSDRVLEPDELKQIIAAGQKISATFAPVLGPAGKPRPWDIEFGFKNGKLWLFQSRPFLGNDALNNIPALASLENHVSTTDKRPLSLEEILR
jgi:hypothetical protein